MPVRISGGGGGLERLKAPEVTLVCLLKIQELEEQRVPEEAGKGGTRGLTPSWSMKSALSPPDLPQEPSGRRAGGEVTFMQGEETVG